MSASGVNFKLTPEEDILLATPEPPIGKGSGVLMGRVFTENLTLFFDPDTMVFLD